MSTQTYIKKIKFAINNEDKQECEDVQEILDANLSKESNRNIGESIKQIKKNKSEYNYFIILMFLSIVLLETYFVVKSVILGNHEQRLKDFITIFTTTNIILIDQNLILTGLKFKMFQENSEILEEPSNVVIPKIYQKLILQYQKMQLVFNQLFTKF